MKTLASYLFALALAVVLTPPYLLANPKIDGVEVTEGAPPGGVTYLVAEDFEETGLPGPATWVEQSGTPTWDKTGDGFDGQFAELDATEQARVEFLPQTEVWAAGILSIDAGALSSSTYSFVGLRNSSGSPGILMRMSAGDVMGKIGVYGNGADQSISSTFTVSTDVRYYWVLRYTALGVCELKMSTTTSFGADPTDTATQFTASFTDTNNFVISRLDFRGNSFSNNHQFDDVFVDDVEIVNPWGP